MRVILHVGPHKTGTTSVQSFLSSSVGSRRPAATVWYPLPKENGPGHAALAWETLGLYGVKPTDELHKLLQRARDSDVERLILSAEDFSRAYFKGIERLRAVLAGRALHLVVSLSAPSWRAISIWQEMVKHGARMHLTTRPDAILKSPGLQPDLLSVLNRHLEPEHISVVLISRNDPPERLLENMMTAMRVPVSVKADDALVTERRNRSLSLLDVELLRQLNVTLKRHNPDASNQQHARVRKALLNALRDERWRRVRPDIPVILPERIKDRLRRLAVETVQEIQGLADRRPITTYGDLDTLLE